MKSASAERTPGAENVFVKRIPERNVTVRYIYSGHDVTKESEFAGADIFALELANPELYTTGGAVLRVMLASALEDDSNNPFKSPFKEIFQYARRREKPIYFVDAAVSYHDVMRDMQRAKNRELQRAVGTLPLAAASLGFLVAAGMPGKKLYSRRWFLGSAAATVMGAASVLAALPVIKSHLSDIGKSAALSEELASDETHWARKLEREVVTLEHKLGLDDTHVSIMGFRNLVMERKRRHIEAQMRPDGDMNKHLDIATVIGRKHIEVEQLAHFSIAELDAAIRTFIVDNGISKEVASSAAIVPKFTIGAGGWNAESDIMPGYEDLVE